MGEREEKLKIKCENNISFPDAREQHEQFYTDQTYASAVKPSNSSKSTQTDDKSTQTDDNITEYKKISKGERKIMVHKEKLTHLLIQEKVTHLILGQPLRRRS